MTPVSEAPVARDTGKTGGKRSDQGKFERRRRGRSGGPDRGREGTVDVHDVDPLLAKNRFDGIPEVETSCNAGEGSVTENDATGADPLNERRIVTRAGHARRYDDRFVALLAAEIIKALDRDGRTVRAAHARTGIAAADFSRIRNADLARFTLDRLVGIINRLGSHVEVKVKVKRATGVLEPVLA